MGLPRETKVTRKINCFACWWVGGDDRAKWDHKHVVFEKAGEQCPCATCDKKRFCKDRCKKFYTYSKLCKYHS